MTAAELSDMAINQLKVLRSEVLSDRNDKFLPEDEANKLIRSINENILKIQQDKTA